MKKGGNLGWRIKGAHEPLLAIALSGYPVGTDSLNQEASEQEGLYHQQGLALALVVSFSGALTCAPCFTHSACCPPAEEQVHWAHQRN